MANYYNEIDLFAAEWLRNLIKEGLIPDGEVDTRSISDVVPNDLAGFTQCHFFAGIAGWSHALRLAGWSEDRPIWTGSCPCQPFSVAGKGKGTADERHLWPVFFNLIRECRPPVVMGEQVSGKAGYGWLDGVRSDLEGENYACRGVDIPACAVDAPHIRQRLYWVAVRDVVDAKGFASGGGSCGDMADAARGRDGGQNEPSGVLSVPAERGARHSDMADANGWDARAEWQQRGGLNGFQSENGCDHWSAGDAKWPSRSVADADQGRQLESVHSAISAAGMGASQPARGASDLPHSGDMADADERHKRRHTGNTRSTPSESCGATRAPDGDAFDCSRSTRGTRNDGPASFWSDAVWLNGADGKARRAQPGVRLLAHGILARAPKLRAYGNAIVPPLAAEVIKAFMDV